MSPTFGMRQTKRKRLFASLRLLTAHSGLLAARHQSSTARFIHQQSGGILMTQAQNRTDVGLVLLPLISRHPPKVVCVWVCRCVSLQGPSVAANTHGAESISASICSCRAEGTLHLSRCEVAVVAAADSFVITSKCEIWENVTGFSFFFLIPVFSSFLEIRHQFNWFLERGSLRSCVHVLCLDTFVPTKCRHITLHLCHHPVCRGPEPVVAVWSCRRLVSV